VQQVTTLLIQNNTNVHSLLLFCVPIHVHVVILVLIIKFLKLDENNIVRKINTGKTGKNWTG